MKSPNPILVGRLDDAIWIRVEGKGSFENSGPIKEFAAKMMAQGLRHFIVDLENCPVMDSTFMGTLTGVALRLAHPDDIDHKSGNPGPEESLGDQGLVVINANPRCVQLMQGLGLDHIFHLDQDGSSFREERELVSRQMHARQEEADEPAPGGGVSSKAATAEIMLEAHEALAEACEENAPRFRDVIEFLKKDLKDLGRPINRPA